MEFDKDDHVKYSSNGIKHESAGGFVFFEDHVTHELFVALLHKIDGSYVIPKGHLKKGEMPEDAARREIKEELSLIDNPKTISSIGINSYSFSQEGDDTIHHKDVHLYVFHLDRKANITPLRSEGFDRAEWISYEEAFKKISFDKEFLLVAKQSFYHNRMVSKNLSKLRMAVIKKLKSLTGKNLFAIVSAGSASQSTYNIGWSDLDFLIVVTRLDFDTKQEIAKLITELESESGIHHGINVINEKEFLSPILPGILFEGKTLQTLIELKKHPERLIYSRKPIDMQNIYSPNLKMLKDYSLSNIGMFLHRNRRTFSTIEQTPNNLREFLKTEIRASLTITKLATQYFTATIQENHEEVLSQAKSIFPDFDFTPLEENIRLISKWQKIDGMECLSEALHQTDYYIEQFSHHVFEKAKG